MGTIREAVTEFLSEQRIAVTGVSRKPQGHGANFVYQRLRDRRYQVFAVNPNADEVEGDPCYQDLKSIPVVVNAVVTGTRPEIAEDTMRECADLGIRHVWMHRSFGAGSVSDAATTYGRDQGITAIDGGCPLMFAPASDPGHRAMRLVLTLTGKVPRKVPDAVPTEGDREDNQDRDALPERRAVTAATVRRCDGSRERETS